MSFTCTFRYAAYIFPLFNIIKYSAAFSTVFMKPNTIFGHKEKYSLRGVIYTMADNVLYDYIQFWKFLYPKKNEIWSEKNDITPITLYNP